MRKLLYYGDSPTAATGFGTVARHILKAIHDTGDWAIAVRGINYFSTIHDYPYLILAAGHTDGEPFGRKAFLRDVHSQDWDLIFIVNDTYVVAEVAAELRRLLEGKKTKLIYYVPVDAKLPHSVTAMISAADQAVAYSRFGLAEIIKMMPEMEGRIPIIPHGCEEFPKLTTEERRQLRAQAFGIHRDETFLWMQVNRNSVRKDIARSIEAFAVFHEFQPDSKYYVHCQQVDNGLDMGAAAADAGVLEHVAFPATFSLSTGGMPRDMLAKIYQIADGFLTTHLGEGWGLAVTEAMSAGLPIVAPYNTTMPEILGPQYPYLYQCLDSTYVDNTGYRPRGTVRDIFGRMKRLYADQRGTSPGHAIYPVAMESSRRFVEQNTWEDVGHMWLALIELVLTRPRAEPALVEAV